jgi:hypothetical protein
MPFEREARILGLSDDQWLDIAAERSYSIRGVISGFLRERPFSIFLDAH